MHHGLSGPGELFGPQGLLADRIKNFEHRPQQERMASLVEQALDNSEYLIVEAPTGTGKTLAYLAPAAMSGRRVVITTATKNLQEQIFYKDLPVLKAAGLRFKAVLMKGRANYLCQSRLARFIVQPYLSNTADAVAFGKIVEWSERTKTGDRSELLDLPDNYGPWNEICSSAEQCTGSKCEFTKQCFMTRLKAQAATADLIVVNHHLFFADLGVRESGVAEVIPRYEAVIFDEAHQIESVASSYFGVQVSNLRMEELARDSVAAAIALTPGKTGQVTRIAGRLRKASEGFFQAFRNMAGREGRKRIKDGMIPPAAEELLDSLRESLTKIQLAFAAVSFDQPGKGAEAIIERAGTLAQQTSDLVSLADPGKVYWCEARERGVFLSATPIRVADELSPRLFDKLGTAVFTSATLSTEGHFSFFKSRAGIDRECLEEVLPTCFDFQNQALLFLPDNLPDPRDESFADRAAEVVRRLIEASSGRAMVLFTSYRNMTRVQELLKGKIPYRLMTQGERPKNALLEEFRNDIHSVLLATSSFWEGVDVQGEALSLVVIDKLPFASPQDPVVESRIEAIQKSGGDAFNEYQVPQAIISLRQGLGRLIRNRMDRGVLSILDGRILSRSYGQTMMRSLPDFKLTRRFEDVDAFFSAEKRVASAR